MTPKKEIIFLAADKNIAYVLEGLIPRFHSLGIRPLAEDEYKIVNYSDRDSGCYDHAHEFLRKYLDDYHYALVMFDREFDEHHEFFRESLENRVSELLAINGWNQRSAVIVIDPELDVWAWSDSPLLDELVGWKGRRPNLRTWLKKNGYLNEGEIKPSSPKEAMDEALRMVEKPRSSKLFRRIAEQVSLHRCQDPAFLKFKSTLQKWFPARGK